MSRKFTVGLKLGFVKLTFWIQEVVVHGVDIFHNISKPPKKKPFRSKKEVFRMTGAINRIYVQ